MKILGTGLSGLVGSRIVELLSPVHTFEDLSLETGVDITNKQVVFDRVAGSTASWVFHFAAMTDVDGAEKERELKQQGKTWRVNVAATGYIVDACQKSGKSLLYISTDYVFDGTKDAYTEDDEPLPQGWYAITKYEGEKRVQTLREKALIIRIANPYRSKNTIKLDFVHKLISLLSQGKPVVTPTDQVFVPTFIDDIAFAINNLITSNACGVYHVVGSQALSPFEATKKIARVFGFNTSLVQATTCDIYFQNRAPRPFRAVLKNDKLHAFGVQMSTFDEGLQKIRVR